MADIFLSYRRQDSSSATGRLADRLEQYFGPRRVFRDYDSIIAGADFAAAIDSAIGVSIVVLAVIGPGWLDARDAAGRRRLDDEHDFVRLEIEAALRTDVPIIPVLVEGAKMPAADALPPSLQALARCQAVELAESRWRDDVERLIANLQAQFGIESEATPGAGGEHIDKFSRFALDMLELATHPRRLIARRQTGQALDHVRAFLFLSACLVLGNLGVVAGLGRDDIVSWLFVGLLFGWIFAALLAIPLALAWRLVGARVVFRQVTLVFAYVYGGAWIGFCAGALFIVVGARIVDPALFEDFLHTLQSGGAAFATRMHDAHGLLDRNMQGVALSAAVIGGLLWLATALWVVAAWGAFRLSYNIARWRAWAATLLWLTMVAGVFDLAAAAARP